MPDNDVLKFLIWCLIFLLSVMGLAVIASFIANGKKAKGVFEEAMKVPGVTYVKIEAGTDAAKDARIMKTCEEALNDTEDDPDRD